MKYAREGRCPTNEYVKEYQGLVAEELRMLGTDELVAKNRKPGHTPEELHVNVAKREGTTGHDKGNDPKI
eukprot:465042-Lingulodinium_polyedra.AAC.1